jgi:hypothetical protein
VFGRARNKEKLAKEEEKEKQKQVTVDGAEVRHL